MMQTGRNKIRRSKRAYQPSPETLSPILWAIDSTKLSAEEVQRTQNILKVINISQKDILTASVFSPFDLGWLVSVDDNLKKKTLNHLLRRTEEKWNHLQIPFEEKGILISESGSIRHRVRALIQYGKKHKAKVITVGSGVTKRSLLTGLGSFSETLIALSPVPVLILHDVVKPLQQVKKILFPTDFSKASQVNFKKVISFAKNYGAEVILYHFLDTEMGPLIYGIPWAYEVKWLADYWQDLEKHKIAEGEKWKAQAERQNVQCRFISDRKPGVLQDRIAETVQENQIDILAVSLSRSPASQVILGRTIRKIIANSTCPVLAFHHSSGKTHR